MLSSSIFSSPSRDFSANAKSKSDTFQTLPAFEKHFKKFQKIFLKESYLELKFELMREELRDGGPYHLETSLLICRGNQ